MFFLALAPSSSIMPIMDVAFEHRMYLSLAALVALVVIGGYFLIARLTPRPARGAVLYAALGLAALAAGVLAYRTYQRNELYHDAAAIWSDVLDQYPNDKWALSNYGKCMVIAGKYDKDKYKTAIECYRKALVRANSEDVFIIQYNLANAYMHNGDYRPAITHYQDVVNDGRMDDFFYLHYEFGFALAQIGRYDQARPQLEQALKIAPGNSDALRLLRLLPPTTRPYP